MNERTLSTRERMRWGECPTCHAPHGDPCYAEAGYHIGTKADGSRLETGEGVHIARIAKAPFKVKEVPA